MEDWKHCPQFAPLADLIRSHGSFAVIAHVHPDGDAIGSTLALGEALKQMGKKVVMMNEDGVPSNLAFMPGVENIIPTPDEPVDVEVAISVDNGALKRLGERSLEALAGVKVWANIDHHRTFPSVWKRAMTLGVRFAGRMRHGGGFILLFQVSGHSRYSGDARRPLRGRQHGYGVFPVPDDDGGRHGTGCGFDPDGR